MRKLILFSIIVTTLMGGYVIKQTIDFGKKMNENMQILLDKQN